jgi:hypothetical protein
MKDLIIPCNVEAHSRALVAIVGEENAQLILKAYKAIDSAMVFGYERGLAEAPKGSQVDPSELETQNKFMFEQSYAEGYKDGMEAAEGYDANLSDQVFKNGYKAGYDDARCEYHCDDQLSYDDGYVAGVSDARVCPADADREVARLCEADEDRGDIYDCSEYTPIDDVYYNGDSGDEQPYDARFHENIVDTF